MTSPYEILSREGRHVLTPVNLPDGKYYLVPVDDFPMADDVAEIQNNIDSHYDAWQNPGTRANIAIADVGTMMELYRGASRSPELTKRCVELEERLAAYETWKRSIEDSGDKDGWARAAELEAENRDLRKQLDHGAGGS